MLVAVMLGCRLRDVRYRALRRDTVGEAWVPFVVTGQVADGMRHGGEQNQQGHAVQLYEAGYSGIEDATRGYLQVRCVA